MEPVDVRNHTRVFEGDDCVINKEVGSVRGVEDMVVCVLRTRAVKVGGRGRTGMEWHGINWGTLLSRTFDPRLVFNDFERDVSSRFRLPLLIDKDEGVLTGVGRVELLPTLTRMLGVLHDDLWFIRRKGVGFRPRGNAMNKGNCGRDR